MGNKKNVQFNGNAGEYFRIWIVNLFLTFVTLGIYSPWAKVINNKYLYQNLSIDSHRFDYIAEPIQILKGRLLAVFLLIIFSILTTLSETLYYVGLLLIFIAAPWIINRSLSFQLRMTTYRNVSFDFKGDYWNTLLYFSVLPFVSVFTLFLALPFFLKLSDEYKISSTRFGDKSFITKLSSGEYYGAFFIVIAASIGIGVIASIIFLLVSSSIAFISGFIAYIAFIAISTAVWTSIIRNHTFNNSKLLDVASFQSNMNIITYCYITFTNIIALIFSLGLASPWVAIRNMKYLSETLIVETGEEIDSVMNDITSNNSAVLDEVAGAFDIEI